MKKLSYLLFASLLAFSFVFVGCGKDDPKVDPIANPELIIKINGNEIEDGAEITGLSSAATVNVSIQCKAEGKINKLVISGLDAFFTAAGLPNEFSVANELIEDGLKNWAPPAYDLPLPAGTYNITVTLSDQQVPAASTSISVKIVVAPVPLGTAQSHVFTYTSSSNNNLTNAVAGITGTYNASDLGNIRFILNGTFVVLTEAEFGQMVNKDDLLMKFATSTPVDKIEVTVDPTNGYQKRRFISKSGELYYLVETTNVSGSGVTPRTATISYKQ